MNVVKNIIIIALCVLLSVSLFGCQSTENAAPTTTPAATTVPGGNDFIADFSQIQSITVYVVPEVMPEGGVEITKREDGTIETLKGFDTLAVVTDPDEIIRILRMFDGWDMTRIPENELLDSLCEVYIRLGDEVMLGFVEKTDAGYYGTVEEVPYYLPDAFGAYMEELLKS